MGQTELPILNEKRLGFFQRSAAWLFSQRHFHFKVLSGTAAGVTVIVLLAGIFLFVTIRNHYQDALRAHTIEVMRQSSLIENDIAALETNHRGYLLTGNPEFVTAFNQHRESIKNRMESLTALVLAAQSQRKRLMKVQDVVQKWIVKVLPEMQAPKGEKLEGVVKGETTLRKTLLDPA